MQVSIGGAASGRGRDTQEQVACVLEAERLGVGAAWLAQTLGCRTLARLNFQHRT